MWEYVAAMVVGIAAARAESDAVRLSPEPEPPLPDCDGCGAPLKPYSGMCDYCRRSTESQMFNWIRRSRPPVPAPAPKFTAEDAELQRKMRNSPWKGSTAQQHSSRAAYSSPPPPAPAFDAVSFVLGASSASHSCPAPAPAPAPDYSSSSSSDSFSSGGGGDYSGGGASGDY